MIHNTLLDIPDILRKRTVIFANENEAYDEFIWLSVALFNGIDVHNADRLHWSQSSTFIFSLTLNIQSSKRHVSDVTRSGS